MKRVRKLTPTTLKRIIAEEKAKLLKEEALKKEADKMKEFFNYKLKYPSYVEGLNYIFNKPI